MLAIAKLHNCGIYHTIGFYWVSAGVETAAAILYQGDYALE